MNFFFFFILRNRKNEILKKTPLKFELLLHRRELASIEKKKLYSGYCEFFVDNL